MPDNRKLVIFVHGWSVSHTNTYGQFPDRLKAEARRNGLELDTRHIWLSKYVSFRDEVRIQDISRAFEEAIHRQLGPELASGRRFICITHSTGGPVIRDWWDRFYMGKQPLRRGPMSHLIMLAPANFGSALAQLGKSRLGRIKSWFHGVEPGTGVLDWLELGSRESWDLNRKWFDYPDTTTGQKPVFLFTLTGQTVDRKAYDHVNSYTGETGSDGVVRVAAANLNATYIKLEQCALKLKKAGNRPTYEAPRFIEPAGPRRCTSPRTAFALIENKAHSGKDLGILRSVRNNRKKHPTVDAVLKCIGVGSKNQYTGLCDEFEQLNKGVAGREQLDVVDRWIMPDRYYIRDPYSMLIIRVQDDHGLEIGEFDLKMTAIAKDKKTGEDYSSPDHLPRGFFQDRQRNSHHRGTLTYFLNHAMITGCGDVKNDDGDVVRGKRDGARGLGFQVEPHATTGLVHFLDAELPATKAKLRSFLKPNQTTMVDIIMRRVVREKVFRLDKDLTPRSFKGDNDGPAIG